MVIFLREPFLFSFNAVVVQGEKAEKDTYISKTLYQEPNAFQDANHEKTAKTNV